jgi:hypothetical protein
MSLARLTPDELAARSRRAVAAATAVGCELGLQVDEPRVLHDVFSVVVHLAPSTVVARVPVVLPPSLDAGAQRARQARELAAVAWLARQGHPVVRPSPLVPLAPVARDGFSITFWEFVEVATDVQPDHIASAPLAAELHAALRGYPGELPFLGPVALTVPSCLAVLEANPDLIAPADLARARREWTVLGPLLSSASAFAAAFPRATLQPIHGDAPSYNLIHTTQGIRYADFEDVTLGPLEWDLAGLGPDAADAYDAAAERRGLRRLDREALRVVEIGRLLQVVACLALVPQLPMLATGLTPILEQWRALPFPGG